MILATLRMIPTILKMVHATLKLIHAILKWYMRHFKWCLRRLKRYVWHIELYMLYLKWYLRYKETLLIKQEGGGEGDFILFILFFIIQITRTISFPWERLKWEIRAVFFYGGGEEEGFIGAVWNTVFIYQSSCCHDDRLPSWLCNLTSWWLPLIMPSWLPWWLPLIMTSWLPWWLCCCHHGNGHGHHPLISRQACCCSALRCFIDLWRSIINNAAPYIASVY